MFHLSLFFFFQDGNKKPWATPEVFPLLFFENSFAAPDPVGCIYADSTCALPPGKQSRPATLISGYRRSQALWLCRFSTLDTQYKSYPVQRYPARGAVQQPAHSPDESQPQWRRIRWSGWIERERVRERKGGFQTGWPTFNTVWSQREREGGFWGGVQKASRNRKQDDKIAGEKDEKENRCRNKDKQRRTTMAPVFVDSSFYWISALLLPADWLLSFILLPLISHCLRCLGECSCL